MLALAVMAAVVVGAGKESCRVAPEDSGVLGVAEAFLELAFLQMAVILEEAAAAVQGRVDQYLEAEVELNPLLLWGLLEKGAWEEVQVPGLLIPDLGAAQDLEGPFLYVQVL